MEFQNECCLIVDQCPAMKNKKFYNTSKKELPKKMKITLPNRHIYGQPFLKGIVKNKYVGSPL